LAEVTPNGRQEVEEHIASAKMKNPSGPLKMRKRLSLQQKPTPRRRHRKLGTRKKDRKFSVKRRR